MPDLDALLKASPDWARLDRRIAGKNLPQTLGCFLPATHWESFLGRVAARVLAGEEAVAAFSEGEAAHPDLLRYGTPDQPPGIEQCRPLGGDLSLAPVTASFRLGVVFCADRLSLPAANSLLKVAEEPPEHGKLLLLAERDALIPTLRSRLTPFFFSAPEAIPAAPYPDSEEAWLAFLERRSAPESNRRSASADLREELQAWTRYCLEKGAYSQADTLNHLTEILSGIPLASSMATDLVALTLGEGLQLDSFFGPVREA